MIALHSPSRLAALGALVLVLASVMPASAPGQEAAPAPHEERAPWHPGGYFAVGVQVSVPYDRFDDDYATGYGLQAIFDYPWIPLLDLSASAGWNRFSGRAGRDAIGVWEVAGGLRLALGGFFMNGEVGWYSEVDDTSFIPGLGWRARHWEISVRAKAAGEDTWTSVRFGWYF